MDTIISILTAAVRAGTPILMATQGEIVAAMAASHIASLSRTLASFGAGVVQTAVLFPLEKLVLFRSTPDGGKETK